MYNSHFRANLATIFGWAHVCARIAAGLCRLPWISIVLVWLWTERRRKKKNNWSISTAPDRSCILVFLFFRCVCVCITSLSFSHLLNFRFLFVATSIAHRYSKTISKRTAHKAFRMQHSWHLSSSLSLSLSLSLLLVGWLLFAKLWNMYAYYSHSKSLFICFCGGKKFW